LIRRTLEQDAGDDADDYRRSNSPIHRRNQLMSAGLPQVRKADRNDEKGLEPFTQGDDERLKHAGTVENEIGSQ
jgi:hypothetical protein